MLQDLMQKADKSGDRKISLEEFIAFFEKDK
jgi:EF hand